MKGRASLAESAHTQAGAISAGADAGQLQPCAVLTAALRFLLVCLLGAFWDVSLGASKAMMLFVPELPKNLPAIAMPTR